jgi:hypothetical protein
MVGVVPRQNGERCVVSLLKDKDRVMFNFGGQG